MKAFHHARRYLPRPLPKEKQDRKEEPSWKNQTGYLLCGDQTQKAYRRWHICEQHLKEKDEVDTSLRRH